MTSVSITAIIDRSVTIGKNVKIWHYVQIREGAVIGDNVIIGKGSYIGKNVRIGNNVKIGNNVSIFEGIIIEDNVFVGPHVCFTNDRYPRATNRCGQLKTSEDWSLEGTLVLRGASIGANSTILPGITIGQDCMIGAGSVVTKTMLKNKIYAGCPARRLRKK